MSAGYDVIVVGGGASGMLAALRCAEQGRARGVRHHVLVLERQQRVGRKLIATGNGRCNLMNVSPDTRRFHGADSGFAGRVLMAWPPQALMEVFEEMGVPCHREADGRVYPASMQASSVVDALRLALDEAGVEVRCGAHVAGIAPGGASGFRLTLEGGEVLTARCVIIAAGGPAAPQLGGTASGHSLLRALGHQINPCVPALTPIKTDTGPIRALKGVRLMGSAAIIQGEDAQTRVPTTAVTPDSPQGLREGQVLRREHGELLFTEYGVSGPPILQLSRLAAKGPSGLTLSLSFFPEQDAKSLEAMLIKRQERFPGRTLETFMLGMAHKRVAQAALKYASLWQPDAPASSLAGGDIRRLASALTDFRLDITGVPGYDQAQVTAGGAEAAQFDPQTLMSRLRPGLFACGEVLDVDGDCGGFNLMWAWASGLIAGEAAARMVWA